MFENNDCENVNSLLNSILKFYTMHNNAEYMYYYILCFVNLKLNSTKNYNKPTINELFKRTNADSKIISNEEEWLLFISSVPKPINVIGNEIEYSLNTKIKEGEIKKLRIIFGNKYPNHNIISRSWYMLKRPVKCMKVEESCLCKSCLDSQVYSNNISAIRNLFNKFSLTLFHDKIKCIIRKDNIKDSWELKIKLQEDQVTYNAWEFNIKQSLEIEAVFGNINNEHSIDKIYLGPSSFLRSSLWTELWHKDTEYMCLYLLDSNDQRIALDVINNKIKYEIENQSFLDKDTKEIALSAHTTFKYLLGKNYWKNY